MTICERCGAQRRFIPDACPSCRFKPKSLRELATAALLTSQFDAGEERYGTPEPALEQIAARIRAGHAPVLDAAELDRHEKTVKAFLEFTDWDLVKGLWLVFRPAVFFLAGLLALLLLLRALNH